MLSDCGVFMNVTLEHLEFHKTFEQYKKDKANLFRLLDCHDHIKEIAGEKLAVINICENEWTIATKTSGGSAPLNLITNIHKIAEAKKNSDYVLVIVHGGTEHYQLPSPRMKETYRFFY